MRLNHYLGIVFLFFCAYLIGSTDNVEVPDKFEVYNLDVTKISAFSAVMQALICPFMFSCMHLSTKIAFSKYGFNGADFQMMASAMAHLTFLIIGIFILPGANIPFEVYIRTFIASIFSRLAISCASYAMTIGKGGPISALTQTQTIWSTVLNYFFLNELIGFSQLSGLIVGLIGSIIISVGP